MAQDSAWSHRDFDYLDEPADKRRFCKLCAKRRKAKQCVKDSLNFDEILGELGLGQRNAMLAFGYQCDEVMNMPGKERREWAKLGEEDLERMRREWQEQWPD